MFHGLPRLPRPGEEVRTGRLARTWGGGTIITAVAAARLGVPVEILSALPDAAVADLAREGVTVRNLKKPREPHAVSVALSTARDRAFATFDGVNEELEVRLLRLFARRLPRAAHVHFALGPRRPRAWALVAGRLRARGTTTSWDFGWHDDLPRRPGFGQLLGALDWVFVNEREATHYSGTRLLARALPWWRTAARATVIKRGRLGALAVLPSAVIRVAAPAVDVVDTTGAGDAMNGGFLAALVSGHDAAACLRAGVLVGSLSTEAAGGLDGLPPRRTSRRAAKDGRRAKRA